MVDQMAVLDLVHDGEEHVLVLLLLVLVGQLGPIRVGGTVTSVFDADGHVVQLGGELFAEVIELLAPALAGGRPVQQAAFEVVLLGGVRQERLVESRLRLSLGL